MIVQYVYGQVQSKDIGYVIKHYRINFVWIQYP